MKDTTSEEPILIKIILSLSFVFLFPALALQSPDAKNERESRSTQNTCSARDLSSEGIPVEWNRLVNQKALLVARQSFFTVQSRSQEVLAQGEQTFRKGFVKTSATICNQEFGDTRYVMSAPTLLDFTESAKVGHKLWNFQMLHQNKKIQFQNIPSLRPGAVAVEAFQSAYKITQLDHYTIRVEYLAIEGDLKKSLIVDYDLVYKI